MKFKTLKFKNSVDCLNNKIEMKRESVSELKDKSIEINQSEEKTMKFFNEQNLKDMWDNYQKGKHLCQWIPGRRGE